MSLTRWQQRLQEHFEDLRRRRTASVGDKPLFALEHGLESHELGELTGEIRAHITGGPPSVDHSLPWIVYAAELGYRYAGDEYWQTFEEETPGWTAHGTRSWLRERFGWFHKHFGGARPSGPWAAHFSIICWPITHAILPRDLQRQLARALYQLRHTFSADLFASPATLGERIAARSWEGTSRFQNLAQETLLIGQIAAALLLEGTLGTAGLLLPATLARIGTDLERERSARDWLRDARHIARERARFRGLSVSRLSGLAPAERAREEVAALGIEPRLVLRPKDRDASSWDVLLEIPDLSHLLLRFPNAREALVESRCTVAGASGRPLARGVLLHGAHPVGLRRWPRHDEVLLQFERVSAEFEYLLRTESLLRPGTTWLFRIASDGLAYELRSLRVRAAQRYVIVSTSGPIPATHLARPVTLSCEGAHGGLLELPGALSPNDEAALNELGLSQARTIHVWPAGLTAAAWDGDGRGEWLATERPCIAVRPDHALGSVVIAFAHAESNPLELGPVPPGEVVFIELPLLPVGVHTVRVVAHEASTESRELLGELELVVREQRPWMPGLSKQGPLIAQVDPAVPTMDQLWEGRVDIELRGPPGRTLACTAILFERGMDQPSIRRALPRLALPVTPAVWRAHFEKHFCAAADVPDAYDRARACEVEFRADELGAFKLHCERGFVPLRWAVRAVGHGQTVRILDDSGAVTALTASRYTFETPDTEERLDPALLAHPFPVPLQGGMYVARQSTFAAALITPPLVRSLSDLRCNPRLPDRSRSPERALHLIDLIGLWASARPTGNLFSASRQRDVLRALTRHLFLTVGGEVWERAELLVHAGEVDLPALRRAVSTRRDEAELGTALASEGPMLASAPIEKRIRHLSSFAQRFLRLPLPPGKVIPGDGGVRLILRQIDQNPGHPDWLTEFALRLASEPAGIASWAGDTVAPGLKRLLEAPTLARAARFLVLAVDQHLRGKPGVSGRVYAGWEWK